jgi:hypothetical protein
MSPVAVAAKYPALNNIIGGEPRPVAGDSLEVFDPSIGQVISRVPLSS